MHLYKASQAFLARYLILKQTASLQVMDGLVDRYILTLSNLMYILREHKWTVNGILVQ